MRQERDSKQAAQSALANLKKITVLHDIELAEILFKVLGQRFTKKKLILIVSLLLDSRLSAERSPARMIPGLSDALSIQRVRDRN